MKLPLAKHTRPRRYLIQESVALIGVSILSLPIAAATPFNICDNTGFQRVETGEFRRTYRPEGEFLEYRISTVELNARDLPLDSQSTLAKSEAMDVFYSLFKKTNPPPSDNADLNYSHMASFGGRCGKNVYFAFSAPIAFMTWSMSSSSGPVKVPSNPSRTTTPAAQIPAAASGANYVD